MGRNGAAREGALDRADAITFLRWRAPALTGTQAGSLAARLGDLPLALDQAAAYLHETGMRPDVYLELLSTRSAVLHGRGQASGYPGTVATVWAVSFGRLDAPAPAAAQLLKLCAWLAPEPIPLDLFTLKITLCRSSNFRSIGAVDCAAARSFLGVSSPSSALAGGL